jgi:hypothetical protein
MAHSTGQKRKKELEKRKQVAQFIAEQLESIRLGAKPPKDHEERGVGRPTDMTPDVVDKLIIAFQMDFTVSEACLFAGIHDTTYYNWKKRDAEFARKILWAQSGLFMQSKANLAYDIHAGNSSISQWVLSTRQRKLYATRTEAHNTNVVITPEEEKQLAEVLERELGVVQEIEEGLGLGTDVEEK